MKLGEESRCSVDSRDSRTSLSACVRTNSCTGTLCIMMSQKLRGDNRCSVDSRDSRTSLSAYVRTKSCTETLCIMISQKLRGDCRCSVDSGDQRFDIFSFDYNCACKYSSIPWGLTESTGLVLLNILGINSWCSVDLTTLGRVYTVMLERWSDELSCSIESRSSRNSLSVSSVTEDGRGVELLHRLQEL